MGSINQGLKLIWGAKPAARCKKVSNMIPAIQCVVVKSIGRKSVSTNSKPIIEN